MMYDFYFMMYSYELVLLMFKSSLKDRQIVFYIVMYLIGHHNRSIRIIDLVSHITYVVCVNFIDKCQDLQFKINSERQIF